jgi:hypothetical protein
LKERENVFREEEFWTKIARFPDNMAKAVWLACPEE